MDSLRTHRGGTPNPRCSFPPRLSEFTMDPISDRHAGTLGGQLLPLDQASPVSVSIVLPKDVATRPACQHTLWMLVNLLARADGIVDRVFVTIPEAVPLASRVVPLAPRTLDLCKAILAGADAINAVSVSVSDVEVETASFRLVVGPGATAPGVIRVHGENWWGGFSRGMMPGDSISAIPLGPYAAAALVSAEIFKAVRLASYTPLASVFYSLWALTVSDFPKDDPDWVGPPEVGSARLDAVVGGVGAVGSTWVHTVWATPGLTGSVLLADSDEFGVDTTNLNRCPIFGRQSVGHRKASEAATICHDAEVTFESHDGTVGTIEPRRPMTMMVSAVDTNRSRQAVQSLYPARLVSGSTNGLRAEVLRCDPTAETACLFCFNPLEAEGESDSEIRRRFLSMSEAERLGIAKDRGVDIDEAIQWATEGTCGYAGELISAFLRPGATRPEEFAVGFVSAMAGTMLAAISIQEALGTGALRGRNCRALFQFFDPLNRLTNSPRQFGRQQTCPMCDPASLAAQIWEKRFSEYAPNS